MDLADLTTHTCDCCDTTYTGRPAELAREGWIRHIQHGRGFLMCSQCEDYFVPLWRRRKEERKAA